MIKTEEEIKNAIGKTKDYVAKCSDPSPADKIRRNIVKNLYFII